MASAAFYLEGLLAGLVVTLLLANGFFRRHPLLLAYLGWFAIGTLLQLAWWLTNLSVYPFVFLALTLISLLLAGLLTATLRLPLRAPLSFSVLACLVLAATAPARGGDAPVIFAALLTVYLYYGAAAWWGRAAATDAFDRIKWSSLCLLWTGKAAAVAALWSLNDGSVAGGQVFNLLYALVGCAAFLWMLVGFSRLQAEGSRAALEPGMTPVQEEGE
ncbi:MAG: hypothetical protein ACE5HB_03405 [Terriglobia bacterium]